MANVPVNSSLGLTGGRLLARNTAWNLIGTAAPMFVAVFCIPILIRGLGKERFGVLTLTWALIGYASLFDLGLGRALTQLVAQKLGSGDEAEIPTLGWTSLLLMFVLGLVGAAIIVALSPWLVHRALHVPPAIQRETLQAFYLLGISIPLVISTAGLRGLLEAYQRFGLINVLRIPMGIFTFTGPLLVLPISKSLFPMVAVLAAGRAVAWLAHLLICLHVVPQLRERIAWKRAVVAPLLRFGGWMTVSNVVGPLMVTLDRFLVGALLSVEAVSYYVTPFELVTKLFVVSGALAGVMFPAFSIASAQNAERTMRLYYRSILAVTCMLAPFCFSIVVFARPLLTIWLGLAFADNSFRVAQILSMGVLFLGVESVPFSLLQAIGRPDLPAKVNLIEVPVYLAAFWFLTAHYGLVGAAAAWSLRAFLDAVVLLHLAHRLLPGRPTSATAAASFARLAEMPK